MCRILLFHAGFFGLLFAILVDVVEPLFVPLPQSHRSMSEVASHSHLATLTAGGETATPPQNTFGDSEMCFCAMTLQCLNTSTSKMNYTQFQESYCWNNDTALENTDDTASFYNARDHKDILSIPVSYYEDLSALKADGSTGQDILEKVLEAGRRVYSNLFSQQPEYQCAHQAACVSVKWLHVHTFTGSVPAEHLPSGDAHAACAFANLTASTAAQEILSKASTSSDCPATFRSVGWMSDARVLAAAPAQLAEVAQKGISHGLRLHAFCILALFASRSL